MRWISDFIAHLAFLDVSAEDVDFVDQDDMEYVEEDERGAGKTTKLSIFARCRHSATRLLLPATLKISA